MHHDTNLIALVAVGLAYALAGGYAAARLGLPPLVGYLAAGIAAGPFTPGFVGDQQLAPQLAEIGVMLLMFGVGMHFSVGDLLAVRRVAVPGAVAQIAVATGLGSVAAWVWGWPVGAGLVFGLALSVASTVVLLRALEARDMVATDDGRIAVGWLVVEDLVMVLTLVLLPALAGPLGGAGGEQPPGAVWRAVGLTLLKVAGFVALMLVVGRRVLPGLLDHVGRTASRELFTLAVIGLALGVAFGSAELFGVSFALGAFFAGVVVHEADLSHKAAGELRPLQDVFAALFFVSVGMLFDPGVLVREPAHVAAVLGVILVGKSAAAYAIVRALGRPPRTGATVSAALAQIGEFSFILAALGVELKLLPPEGQSLLVAGALLSITLNPLAFALAGWWAPIGGPRAADPLPDRAGGPKMTPGPLAPETSP